MQSSDDSWESKAACKGSDIDWFSSDKDEKYEARIICQSQCPVRRECISAALTEKRIFGIWGGVDDYEIRRTLSVDAFGVATNRTRPPRCPYCLSRALEISGTKSKKGYKTVCTKCDLTWHMATIPTKLKTKKTAK
jgi:hypothetical protein